MYLGNLLRVSSITKDLLPWYRHNSMHRDGSWWVMPLHSSVSPEHQKGAFTVPLPVQSAKDPSACTTWCNRQCSEALWHVQGW